MATQGAKGAKAGTTLTVRDDDADEAADVLTPMGGEITPNTPGTSKAGIGSDTESGSDTGSDVERGRKPKGFFKSMLAGFSKVSISAADIVHKLQTHGITEADLKNIGSEVGRIKEQNKSAGVDENDGIGEKLLKNTYIHLNGPILDAKKVVSARKFIDAIESEVHSNPSVAVANLTEFYNVQIKHYSRRLQAEAMMYVLKHFDCKDKSLNAIIAKYRKQIKIEREKVKIKLKSLNASTIETEVKEFVAYAENAGLRKSTVLEKLVDAWGAKKETLSAFQAALAGDPNVAAPQTVSVFEAQRLLAMRAASSASVDTGAGADAAVKVNPDDEKKKKPQPGGDVK